MMHSIMCVLWLIHREVSGSDSGEAARHQQPAEKGGAAEEEEAALHRAGGEADGPATCLQP